MSSDEAVGEPVASQPLVSRGLPSAFESLITTKPPVLASLLAQLPTDSILNLYHSSSFLNQFFRTSPTSWRYISMRLHQPAQQSVTPTANNHNSPVPRQASNYALDQLLLYVINPFSTRLTTLELDNTSVSGATLFQTVMVLRKDTLEHVSVRGCKNVSLKYHINPWLMMHAMALDRPSGSRAPGYEKLALKSLYTYRCRHHRRRPYLPSSLARKESDSEPTHELVLTCHKLGIWTDTAWCTTPGARCFRRRGYVTMRVPQDPREVWVVFDRLWRSRNWLGPLPDNSSTATTGLSPTRKRKRDCRSWEFDEEAMNGEPLGTNREGKAVPAHARQSHRKFVEDVYCDNCSDPILERCEQCSVMMHCSGCRKVLCASCAFNRPYLRNKNAPDEERSKFWWAPGCAISPCSMQDQDLPPPGPAGNAANPQPGNLLPSIKFRWCCTEPVFSGGGGITFGTGSSKYTDRIRAAPLKAGQGWEDHEFLPNHDLCNDEMPCLEESQQIGAPLSRASALHGSLGGRWSSIDKLFQPDPVCDWDQGSGGVPRVLCDECYTSEQWKIKCKACFIALCLKHDVKDRLKVRICGYKDLTVEKSEYKSRQRALKVLFTSMLKRYKCRKEKMKALETETIMEKETVHQKHTNIAGTGAETLSIVTNESDVDDGFETPRPTHAAERTNIINATDLQELVIADNILATGATPSTRPISPGSNSTGPPSRASSPTPSTRSIPITPEPKNFPQRPIRTETSHPLWKGCQSFFCPSIRTPGDHRRRCVAVMRQCAECKVYVCEQCMTSLEPPCPCKGCRVSGAEVVSTESSMAENLRFFCPNCRWTRRKSGKCKKKIAESRPKKDKKKRKVSRHRKPIEQRESYRPSQPTENTVPLNEAYEYLTDFMRALELGDAAARASPEVQVDTLLVHEPVQVDAADAGSPEEIRQLEDMGALARDLILRIQTLRQQFGPGSLAALALPNVTLQDPVFSSTPTRDQDQSDASAVPPGILPQPQESTLAASETTQVGASSQHLEEDANPTTTLPTED